ncbi:transmembrane protein 238-like [Denticeps clupeoides]|uniref:transmembrane protein 238-like n=1 Tax=Denticeps clupeoides TaxID=299321 RepID=UPI0010A47C3A|nr:transmembrane protein 238-like [Denticeps clupeoides]XP_028844258.1 transmembrane protein 238-like [Denticeps clupeoides]
MERPHGGVGRCFIPLLFLSLFYSSPLNLRSALCPLRCAARRSRCVTGMERAHGGVGRCKCAFWFAVAHDVLGFIILLSGVFANVFFHDFLMYVGAVVIFLSLIWWIFWYTGNIEAAPQELDDDVGFYRRNKGLSGVVRKVTNGIRSSLRRGGGSAQGPGVLAMGARSAQPTFSRETLAV